MNTALESHIEELAMIEDVDRYWHLPLPEFPEDTVNDLGALLSKEKNRRRQRRLRRAQHATASAAISCAMAR